MREKDKCLSDPGPVCGNAFAFSSKADVLAQLSAYGDLHIPALHSFTVEEWLAQPAAVLEAIRSRFAGDKLAVRSSCRREDSADSSCAGAFLSRLNVDAGDADELKAAIDDVLASYGGAQPDDQVLVQPMIADPAVTGVIMTRVLSDGSPYYVINYDDESGTTDSITGGGRVSKTVHVFRGVRDEDFDSPRLRSFVGLARRLEQICGSTELDIEFCLDGANVLHLLQCRPICAGRHWPPGGGEVPAFIDNIADFVAERTGVARNMFGQRSILGVMPDWNPAEMIGVLPRPLASSLYRCLITARVWSAARKSMGYREMPAAELMLLIMGRPYIDVRASFNSFLPAGLDDVTSEALVTAWLERLENNPQLHDKVEFEIAQTALDFCFDMHLDERFPGLLTSERRRSFRSCLCRLTRSCLDLSTAGSLHAAFERIAELRLRQSGRPLPRRTQQFPLSTVNELLEECRELGTLPFSVLARHAFVAENLLRTAVKREALAPERLKEFKLSIRTISSELSEEFLEVCRGERDPENFLRKYGHLRPGSYDIMSPRYADRENLFVAASSARPETSPRFVLRPAESQALSLLLAEHDLSMEPDALLGYARKAIEGRELAKFIFSRNLSDALEIMALWGERLGFSRDDVSFMDLNSILDQKVAVLPEAPRNWFAAHVELNRNMFEKARALKLGYLIRSVRDVYIAPQHRAAPNFIGSRSVAAPLVNLGADTPCDTPVEGRIVCIENADPGFDWIFTRNIAGLITEFGGANSHMAIRCAEYGLPAAIGVGELLFEEISAAENVFLDPASAVVRGGG